MEEWCISGSTFDDPDEAGMVLACLFLDALAHLNCLDNVHIGTNNAVLVLCGHLRSRSNGLWPATDFGQLSFLRRSGFIEATLKS